MDREFVVRNQIVERYIGGRLPLKGAQDFERFCRAHPEVLDEIGLSERINAALRLLDASGRASPFEERATPWWQKLPVLLAVAALALVFAILAVIANTRISLRDHTIATLTHQMKAQTLDPAESTHTVTVVPSRTAPSRHSLVTFGGGAAQTADLKIDVSWAQFTAWKVTIDRLDQGRVAVLHNVLRDSNGNIHIEFNTSALGPGEYQLTMEGLTWKGEPVPQAWATITIAH